jgi:hypothetical protein
VRQGYVRLLDVPGDLGWHTHADGRFDGSQPPCFPGEQDIEHTRLLGLTHGSHDVLGITTGTQAQQNVAFLTERLYLSGEYVVKPEVIGERRKERCISRKGNRW